MAVDNDARALALDARATALAAQTQAASATASATAAATAAATANTAAATAQTAAATAKAAADTAAAAVASLSIPAAAPYVVGFSFISALEASEVFGFHVAGVAFTLPANFAGAFTYAVGVNPTASQVLTLKVNGTAVGTFTVSTAGVITGSTSGAVSVARGALITLEGPAAADATAAKIGITLIGTR